MGLTVRLETLSRRQETRSMLALMDQKKNSGKMIIHSLFHCFLQSSPALPLTQSCPWQYYITCNIIVIVWSHNIAFAGTMPLHYPLPLDGAATEMKVSLAPHASFDQKQFALTWPVSEFQQCFSASQLQWLEISVTSPDIWGFVSDGLG